MQQGAYTHVSTFNCSTFHLQMFATPALQAYLAAAETRWHKYCTSYLIDRRSESDRLPVLSRLRRQLAVAEGRKEVRPARRCRDSCFCCATSCCSPAVCAPYEMAFKMWDRNRQWLTDSFHTREGDANLYGRQSEPRSLAQDTKQVLKQSTYTFSPTHKHQHHCKRHQWPAGTCTSSGTNTADEQPCRQGI